jgi:hypothetical protein
VSTPRVDARPGRATPVGGHGHRTQRLDPAPQPGRHHLHHLGQHPHRGLGDTLHRALRGGLQPHGQGDRLLVVDRQRRQCRARSELVAAVDAALRLDRIAQFAQPVDVPAQGADRDAQLLGQFSTWPVPVGLEQRQQPQRPGAGVRHVLDSSAIPVRK